MLFLAAVGGPRSLQLNFPVHLAKLRTRHAVSARMPSLHGSEQRQDDRAGKNISLKLTGGKEIPCERPWGLKCKRIPRRRAARVLLLIKQESDSQSHSFVRRCLVPGTPQRGMQPLPYLVPPVVLGARTLLESLGLVLDGGGPLPRARARPCPEQLALWPSASRAVPAPFAWRPLRAGARRRGAAAPSEIGGGLSGIPLADLGRASLRPLAPRKLCRRRVRQSDDDFAPFGRLDETPAAANHAATVIIHLSSGRIQGCAYDSRSNVSIASSKAGRGQTAPGERVKSDFGDALVSVLHL